MNIPKLAYVGNIVSLENSFKPSAKGWRSPNTPTTFGPFLIWIEARTFLSANVKYATPINKGTTKLSIFIVTSIKNNMAYFLADLALFLLDPLSVFKLLADLDLVEVVLAADVPFAVLLPTFLFLFSTDDFLSLFNQSFK